MSVFTKTTKGLAALKDLHSGMPRRMRTVLWCINGQTSTATLMRSLTSVGDVKELMRYLIAEGLIERVPKNTAGPAVARSDLSRVSGPGRTAIAASLATQNGALQSK